MAEVVIAIGYVMTAYSAVMAVKALADGDIMGAVVAGVGAYAGFTATSAFAASTAASNVAGGAATNAASSMITQAPLPALNTASTGALAGIEGIASVAPATSLLNSATPLVNSGMAAMAPTVQAAATTASTAGIIDRAIAGATEVIDGGLQMLEDGTLMDKVGKIFDQTGQLISGGNAGLLNSGLKIADLYMKDRQASDAQDSLEDRQAYYDGLYANRGKVPENVATYTQLREKFDRKDAVNA